MTWAKNIHNAPIEEIISPSFSSPMSRTSPPAPLAGSFPFADELARLAKLREIALQIPDEAKQNEFLQQIDALIAEILKKIAEVTGGAKSPLDENSPFTTIFEFSPQEIQIFRLKMLRVNLRKLRKQWLEKFKKKFINRVNAVLERLLGVRLELKRSVKDAVCGQDGFPPEIPKGIQTSLRYIQPSTPRPSASPPNSPLRREHSG